MTDHARNISVIVTLGRLAHGPAITQYGTRAPITLDSASLGYPGNYGRPHGWSDASTPKTDRPVRFVWVHRAGYRPDGRGAVLGYLGVWNHRKD